MPHLRPALAAAAVTALTCGVSATGAQASGVTVLTAHSYTAKSYAPTFTGNGLIGVRVPPAGQGYAGGTVPAQSELAGFYAIPTKPAAVSDSVQQRANIPTWSTLRFGDGTQTYSPATGTLSGWRQSLNLHTGVISTAGTWTAPDGHRFGFSYEVFTDRADAHIGVVHLALTPQFTGNVTISDEIDGAPATLTDPVTRSADPASAQITDEVATQTTGIDAAIVSQLTTSVNAPGSTPIVIDTAQRQSIGQQTSFPVTRGQTYQVTKYVAVDNSQDSADPVADASAEASAAAQNGFIAISEANNVAWAQLWRGRIDVSGNPTLADDVNASEFYLWSNTRQGEPWSISPAGLSSNGYDGHIFWDAETWMYPSLLAQHPALAAEMNDYRFNRLTQAQQHARSTGFLGARFPWESALDGTEQIPPPVSINSEGLYETHITADIALAQWQYYLVTGDRQWLQSQGYPVISGAATFWASRARRGADGRYHLNGVTGPDEENPDVNDEAYTVNAARTTLEDAVTAAHILGATPPASWVQVAAHLSIPTERVNGTTIVKEFTGYRGQLVKQADVTLLQYPWLAPLSKPLATADLNYYIPRTDPGGPSMSDAVNEIDSSALNLPGCAAYVDTERSVQPFIRDVFDQFSETRYGGAFTFMTGIGGFLQEFLFGYSGMRWQANGVALSPSLNRQISGITLHDVQYRGRVFTVHIGLHSSTLTLQSGPPLSVNGHRVAHSITLKTQRPDTTATGDRVRCTKATATSNEPGEVPLSAVDGSPATGWQPTALPATLTTPLTRSSVIRHITVQWGRLWPGVTKPNVAPRPGPVRTLRADRYLVQASQNDRRWSTVATVANRSQRTTDTVSIPATRARYIRLVLSQRSVAPIKPTKANADPPLTTPILEELTVR